MKYKPGNGWKHLTGAVYENGSGTRMHLLGTCRLSTGEFISADEKARRFMRICDSRKRGLMVWANTLVDL